MLVLRYTVARSILGPQYANEATKIGNLFHDHLEHVAKAHAAQCAAQDAQYAKLEKAQEAQYATLKECRQSDKAAHEAQLRPQGGP